MEGSFLIVPDDVLDWGVIRSRGESLRMPKSRTLVTSTALFKN